MRKMMLSILVALCLVAGGFESRVGAANCLPGKHTVHGYFSSVGAPGWNYMTLSFLTPNNEGVSLEHITNFEKWRDVALDNLKKGGRVYMSYWATCVDNKMVESTILSITKEGK